MDYWSCALEGRASMFSDELDFPVDARNRKPLAGWESSFSELPREPLCSDQTGVFMLHNGEAVVDSARNVEAYASVVRSSSSVESVSNHDSSSVMESNSRDTPSSDLKLGGFADSTDGWNDKLSGGRPMFSASPTPPQAKRARTVNTRSQTPLCQVYGCNKNLSSSKDYHKRHRVCDVHSKTPRVIVNGMEQRFCQQCSRFHLLVEFDEGKRSCRRRLAGHNERRRKPHLVSLAGKTHRLLQSYRGGFVAPESYEQVNWSTNVKLEEESVMIPTASSSILHLHGNRSTCASRISLSPTTDSTRAMQSSCALSLLSANSQYLGHIARDTMARPLSSHPNFNGRGSDNLPLKQMASRMVYSADHPLKSYAAFDESNLFDTTLSHSPEEVSTVNLLQLSSHLQRVEQQRTFLQVKDENDDFFSFRTLH